MKLKGKSAVITGGGRGIGKEIALAFSKEGARVMLAARTQEEIESTADEILRSGGEANWQVCDVTREDQVESLVDQTLSSFDSIDILVNNAGAGIFRPAYGTPLKSWEHMHNTNVLSTFLCTKHVWRPMRRVNGGSIINVSSLSGTRAYPMYAAYSASKWGQIGFTKATAEEGKPVNIRVNAIAPGKVDTIMRAPVSEDKSKILKPQDCVGAALFFASDDSLFITGQVIEIEWFGPDK